MNYGHFDDERREYVITDPRTPVKWINYIGTLDFGGFVDHTGGALLCRKDPALNRITKYITQTPSSDMKGETLYLRVKEGEGWKVFSPFFVPTLDAFERFETRVGLGYSTILSEMHGICCEVTIFVPAGACVEVRRVRVTNMRDTPVVIDAIPVAEYSHPDALKQLTNADWVPQTMTSRMVEHNGLTMLTQYPFMLRDTQINFFSASLPASSFETDRREFLGANEYGTWQHPLSLYSEQLGNHQANRGDNIAALLILLGELQPGETVEFTGMLGTAVNLMEAGRVIDKYRDGASVETALADLAAWWQAKLDVLQVHTPDPDLDRMVNVYNLRQCWTTHAWSRYLSYYQLGYGARGIGTRDSSQDVLAILPSGATEAQALIEKLLSVQKRDGSAMHQFNPLSMVASEGDALEREDRPHYYSDDALWLVLAVTGLVKESGDFGFLDKTIPFYDKDKQEQPIESGSVLEHLRRALAFTRVNIGAHGLPLLGFADWNDTVNLPTGAESLFTANLYGRALLEMRCLCEHLGDQKSARQYEADYAEMKQRVEACAWDGEWYVRYFNADGSPLGSKSNTHGQIYINAQSWAVLSGFAGVERARQAMDSVHDCLDTRYGIKLSTPGYNGFDPRVGGVTTYPPGAKENGGIFLHTNPWAMIAETMLGYGDRAKLYYDHINPARHNDEIEVYECEPYVYAQNILGDEHPQFGLGRNSWLSGTASWAYQAATQYILGVRADYDGLVIDPCIPSAWEGFTLTRRFRDAVYRIQVNNPGHVCKGVMRIVINNIEGTGNRIPLGEPGSTYEVEVWLGKA